MADGSSHTVQVLLIYEVKIGRHIVRNVRAGISDYMLLAFPILNGIAPFTIDTRTKELVFHTGGQT